MHYAKCIFWIICCIICATAAEGTTAKPQDFTALSKASNWLESHPNFKRIGTAVALIAVSTAIVFIASIVYPLFAIKMCYYFGSCNPALIAAHLADQYLTPGTFGGRRTRSADYLGPILQTLVNAYEVYGAEDGVKKNFPKASY